jgi:hypothetical protein
LRYLLRRAENIVSQYFDYFGNVLIGTIAAWRRGGMVDSVPPSAFVITSALAGPICHEKTPTLMEFAPNHGTACDVANADAEGRGVSVRPTATAAAWKS